VALGAGGGRLRGIGVAQPGIAADTLRRWARAGVRGLRFVDMRNPQGQPYVGSVDTGHIEALAPLMRELGLHAQLWAPVDDYEHLLPRLFPLGVPLVLDHMACLDVARGVGDPSFQRLLAWLEQGAIWIKLSVCRVSKEAPSYADLKPFHDALVAANSGRLLWGSDWPFVRMGAASPDVGALLDLFYAWVRDAGVRQRILVDNPAALYGF
jgi:predicted TIM-barrel fold metal-dependent hydrolase